MSTLFDTDNRSAGWHLSYLELFNWGTFHQKVYRLSPHGKNSLLTGANGSGKTTVVDALITLLVPPSRRHYNQSSGADKKKERDETSYFLGAFGTLRDEESTGGTTQYLRTKEDYSVVLACFSNESFQQEATLAQVRWWSNGTFKRLYILSTSAMEIEKDFAGFDSGPQWRKTLSAHHPVKFFDTFALYGQAFSSLFGLRSEKALNLFSHVVGVKVLGDLNEFIRENMLDLADMEEDFNHLKKNYDDLLGAHKQIEKAREQLRLLDPVVEKGKQWELVRERKTVLDHAFDVIAPVFAAQQTQLLKEALQKEEARLIAVDSRKLDLDAELESLRRKERDWEFALRDNRGADMIQSLEREAEHRASLRDAKFKLAEEYDALAHELGLKIPETENEFWQTREEVVRQKSDLEERIPLQANAWADLRQNLRVLEDEFEKLNVERDALESRESLIPNELVALRARLCADLEFKVENLPFAGELFCIPEDSVRPVLERLLQPFSLSLVVPIAEEQRVRAWLDEQSLAQSIRLFVLKEESDEHFFVSDDQGLIVRYVEFRKGTASAQTLQNYLRKTWDFRFCESLDQIPHHSRAVHASGWIKDQRLWTKPEQGWNDPEFFYTGWETTEKLRAVRQKLVDLKQKIVDMQSRLDETTRTRQELDERRIRFEKLLAFQNYGELAHEKDAAEIVEIERRLAELRSGNSDLDSLQNQLAEVRLAIRDKNKEKDEASAFVGRVKKTIEEYVEEEKIARKILLDYADLDLDAAKSVLEPWFKQVNRLLDLGNLANARDEVLKNVTTERKSKTEDLKVLERELEQAMHKFVNPGAEMAQRFPEWTGETAVLMAKSDYLEEFRKIHQRILQEDLPGYQKRFKDWLNQRLVEDMADFKTSLENHQRAIVETVKELNSSLKTITYTAFPATFIQLHTEESRDAQIRDFRRMLREALQMDENDLEKTFLRIRSVIQSLSENEDWRKKVTDVRNWMQFAAIEKFAEDGSQRQYYQDSQSLSGGEKAKLAYTILASAIAHQFGIHRDSVASRSFRFAVVDEAFSKVDPENSKFAMNLFEQLNLQLMVVTPLDKINLVEDYIHTIHYVENKRRKTSSVYDLSIEDYKNPALVQTS